MAITDLDLSAESRRQLDGQATISTTLSANKMVLPGWVTRVDVYLDHTTAGTFTRTDPASGRPLPPQTWTRVWDAIPGAKEADQQRFIWFACGSSTQTLHFLVS